VKTLLLTQVFPPQTGGSGRWLYEVYRRMPPGSVVVAAGEFPGAETFDAQQNVPIRRMPLTFPTWGFFSVRGLTCYVRAYQRLVATVRREQAGQVHCGKCLPEGWLAWLLKQTHQLPYVCYVHGEELAIAASGRELAWLMRRVLGGARQVVANSHNTAQLLRAQWQVAAQRLVVLHPGVDAGRFVPAPRDEHVRCKLGWSGRQVVLTVGRLQRRKGHDMLIRALPEIARQVPSVLFAIVGEGEERGRLEALAAELGVCGHVLFHGELSDAELIACYQQCDLFALPNREVDGDFEGFGMVLVEAQACGRPVLAGASGGTRETLVEAQTGVVVDCTRPEPLAAAVSALLRDEPRREAMGRAARDWAAAHFDWNSLAQAAAEVLGLAGASAVRSQRGQEACAAP
jgi:phosphatidylinositol alpha-1,6-mannosyltransferase